MVTKKNDAAVIASKAPVDLIRKQAFKEAADRLRGVAADLLQSRELVQASTPKFVIETAAFKMETRSILERVNGLLTQAAYIEAME